MESDRRAGICTISALATIKMESGPGRLGPGPSPAQPRKTHLKTVARLLAIPDGAGQWKFTANTIFANSTQGSSAQFFGFHIMRYIGGGRKNSFLFLPSEHFLGLSKEFVPPSLTFQPQGLELGVILGREVVMLEQAVQLLVLAAMECNDRLGLQHGLVQLQLITLWQRPEEAAQSFDVARLLQNLCERCGRD